MNSGILCRGLFKINPASVVASVRIDQRFDDEKGGDDFGPGFGSGSGFPELEECPIPEGSVVTPMSSVLADPHVKTENRFVTSLLNVL